MKPTKIFSQESFLDPKLSKILNPGNELFILSHKIAWEHLEIKFAGLFSETNGAPAKPVRLVIGLLMLENMYGISDEEVVSQWVQNPYWQYFCGYDHFQWKMPVNPSSMSRWRKRLGEEGLEYIFSITIKAALDTGSVKKSSLSRVIVDTTVMPKNITFPTDGKLYLKGLQTLVKMAKENNIPLRQPYTFLAPRALRKVNQYAHARQMKRAKKEVKRLKTYLGRLYREILRQIQGHEVLKLIFMPTLEIIEKLLAQEKSSKEKVYSIHEPKVECISKGKPHKKYEFGCKSSLVVTHKEGLAICSEALHGNPYDGHTLGGSLETAERITNVSIKQAFVDKGYRGHGVEGKRIMISGQKKGVTKWFKKQLKRRQAIEPHIGHMKSDGKLGRNFLKGVLGDKLNAILCGVGHNLRLIVNHIKLSEVSLKYA